MWQAGKQAGVCRVRISLQGTRQHLSNFCYEFYQAGIKKRSKLYDTFLRASHGRDRIVMQERNTIVTVLPLQASP